MAGMKRPDERKPVAVIRLPKAADLPLGRSNLLSLTSGQRRESRLRAIADELDSMTKTAMVTPLSVAWRQGELAPNAPYTVVKRKTDRFRLPRRVKADLINRLCSDEGAELSGIRALLVVAHPDDETIGAGARLCQLPDAWVVEVTDGAPRSLDCAQRHGYGTREAYAEARRKELHDALAIAGLPEDRLISLDFVDGEATLRLAELCIRITELIDTLQPDVILTHPYEGGHTDHDSTAFAVHLACGLLRREGVRPPAVLELTSYHARNGEKVVNQFLPHPGADRDKRFLELGEEERELKQRMFECFSSQRPVLDEFTTEYELFRPAPRYNFTRPPHEGRLNYERYGNPERGQAWRAQALRALKKLRVRRD
jgi:LmbE family N-acetylglucosaminyl deacetylase